MGPLGKWRWAAGLREAAAPRPGCTQRFPLPAGPRSGCPHDCGREKAAAFCCSLQLAKTEHSPWAWPGPTFSHKANDSLGLGNTPGQKLLERGQGVQVSGPGGSNGASLLQKCFDVKNCRRKRNSQTPERLLVCSGCSSYSSANGLS